MFYEDSFQTESKRKQNQFKLVSLFAYLIKLFINGNKNQVDI